MNRDKTIPALHSLIMLICICLVSTAYAERVIRLNTTGKPPLNTPQQNGFMDDVATEAFKRIGVTLKTVQLPAERGLKNANAGIDDGEMSRIAGLNKTYNNLIKVPEKIMDWEFIVFTRKNTGTNWNDLASQSVSFINGWKVLESNVPASANIVKVHTPEQLFLMLERKRVDFIIYERWAGSLYLQKPALSDVSAMLPPLAVRDMYIYLHKKNQDLVVKLAASLKQLKDDGTYEKIYRKHLAPLIKP